MNGWQRWFQPSMKRLIATVSSLTLAKVPRRIACLVMMPKKTRFSQDPGRRGEVQRDPRVLG